jgi:dTDP-4-amino-4,6-dideoxygalactose transaminase
MSFKTLFDFESALAEYTGAPFVVVTDGCTHALELCFRYKRVKYCQFPAHTYISIPQMLNQVGVHYRLTDDEWLGEYHFYNTGIWDSARRLERGMYRPGQFQCLSFGHTKPLELGKAGAILLDDPKAYQALSMMRSDGRDLRIQPWQEQKTFEQGYHYCPTLETCSLGLEKLKLVNEQPKYQVYPDLRTIDFS